MESEKTSGSDAQVGKEDVTIREEASVRENVEAREEASVRENVEAREEAAADTTVREDAAESVSEDQNGQNTNADADTVRKEPQEEVLEEWKD